MDHPETRELVAYGQLIIHLSRKHSGRGWLLYDTLFRQQKAAGGAVPWSELSSSIVSLTVLETKSCNLCFSSDHTRVVIESHSSIDDSSSEEVEEQRVNSEESDTEPEERTESTVRRSQRETKKPDYGVWINTASDVSEPNTVEQALSCSQKENWKEAMGAEFQSLQANQVWDLVPPPKDRKVSSSKWVFKCKVGENGLVEHYKARLVAQGYSQRPGIDYEETSSPVVRFESVRSVIALAACGNMKLHQMDVKTAFLNGELSEEVFMSQPEGFVGKGKESFVCHLKKSIYGLKQSPCCWNTALDAHLKRKFVQTKGYPCLYVSTDGAETIIIAYM